MKLKFITFAILGIMVSGCAVKTPLLPEPLHDLSAQHWKVTDYKLLSKQIFAVDQQTEMQQYITQVLSNNPDLKSISATAKAASDNVKIARAEIRPSADLTLSKTRGKDIFDAITDTVSVSVDVNWKVDIWKKLSDDAAATQHLSDKIHYELQQLRRELVSQSARLWVEFHGYVRAEKHFINLTKAQANVVSYYQDAYQEGLIPFSYYQGAFQAGLVPYEFFLDAKNSQLRSEYRLQEIQLEKLKTLQLMNILRGHLPNDEFPVIDDNVPLGLVVFKGDIPATVLINRPDIQAAFSEVRSFNRLEISARKALLPQINLTSSLSKSGITLEKALRGDLIWQLVGGLTQPLFNSGQLRSIIRQKSAEAEASWWQYQNTVFKAMLEVENVMIDDQLLSFQLTQNQALLNNTNRKLTSAEERFLDGDLSLSDYLLIKMEHIEAQIELSNIEALYIKNRIILITALGLPLEILHDSNSGENSHEKS
ncbi:MAG: TolC family protein [Gammaproteobacteria bacterium]|nr:TolC family protein [Gammaproteobacteria bacterium]MCF6364119.1 TolC family protein [Gammaproteobacteria bacterium]